MTEFKLNDIVEWCGVRGIVREVDGTIFSLIVDFGEKTNFFTADGRLFDWHKEPSLKLIERPKRMEKRRLKGDGMSDDKRHAIFKVLRKHEPGTTLSLEEFDCYEAAEAFCRRYAGDGELEIRKFWVKND